jgi:hypothetical protein
MVFIGCGCSRGPFIHGKWREFRVCGGVCSSGLVLLWDCQGMQGICRSCIYPAHPRGTLGTLPYLPFIYLLTWWWWWWWCDAADMNALNARTYCITCQIRSCSKHCSTCLTNAYLTIIVHGRGIVIDRIIIVDSSYFLPFLCIRRVFFILGWRWSIFKIISPGGSIVGGRLVLRVLVGWWFGGLLSVCIQLRWSGPSTSGYLHLISSSCHATHHHHHLMMWCYIGAVMSILDFAQNTCISTRSLCQPNHQRIRKHSETRVLATK